MVKELQVARINGHRLVSAAANKITTADIVGPSGATVSLARERSRLARGLRRPRAAEAGSREGAEVSAVCANALHNHQVLVLALHAIDLDSFEESVL